jgi:hypothetical protein
MITSSLPPKRTVHRQNVEGTNAESKKRRKTKRRKGHNVEWKKRRLGQNVEWEKRLSYFRHYVYSVFCPIRHFVRSTFFTIRHFVIRHFVPFNVLSVRHFLPFDISSFGILSHSMFCRSMFFTFGICYFNILSVNREDLLPNSSSQVFLWPFCLRQRLGRWPPMSGHIEPLLA